MNAGKLDQRIELLTLEQQETRYQWRLQTRLWAWAEQKEGRNIFSQQGKAAPRVEFVLRRRKLTLHQALRWRGQRCQHNRLGSGAGYAAVSPPRRSAPPRYPATGPDSPGAVTNYLEHGWLHRSGRRAAPRRMYQQAEAQLTHRAENEAQRLAQRIVRGLKDD